MKKFKVYRYTNKVTGMHYIGVTCNSLKKRQGSKSMLGYSDCPVFYNAIKKYGMDNFELSILHKDLTEVEANDLEVIEIENHNSISPNGYNLRSGGGVRKHHVETKKKISIANKGRKRPDMVGDRNPMRQPHIRSMFEGENNSSKRPEVRKKLSKKSSGENNGMYGKKHSQGSIESIRKSCVSDKNSNFRSDLREPDVVKSILYFYNTGYSINSIAKAYNTSYRVIKSILKN